VCAIKLSQVIHPTPFRKDDHVNVRLQEEESSLWNLLCQPKTDEFLVIGRLDLREKRKKTKKRATIGDIIAETHTHHRENQERIKTPTPQSPQFHLSNRSHLISSFPFTSLLLFDSWQSSKRPLRPPLDELIHQKAQIGQNEAAHVESEELRCMANAELEADVRLRRVLEPWVFDLAGNLICENEAR
jgi:hypothetical protein